MYLWVLNAYSDICFSNTMCGKREGKCNNTNLSLDLLKCIKAIILWFLSTHLRSISDEGLQMGRSDMKRVYQQI